MTGIPGTAVRASVARTRHATFQWRVKYQNNQGATVGQSEWIAKSNAEDAAARVNARALYASVILQTSGWEGIVARRIPTEKLSENHAASGMEVVSRRRGFKSRGAAQRWANARLQKVSEA